MTEVRFKINKRKVIEALVFLAERQPHIDVFHIAKVLFYADMTHLRKYGRPVLGDQYFALDDGPVPSFALDIVRRRHRFVASEWVELAERKMLMDDSDGYMRLVAAREAFDDSLFSRTDIECLRDSLAKYGKMEFMELWRHVHKEDAWKGSYQGSGTRTPIPFEALIPANDPSREEKLEQLRELSAVTEI